MSLSGGEAEITLADIHAAVAGDKGLWQPREDIPHRCIVSTHVTDYFAQVDAEASAAARTVLAERTLESALADIRAMD